MVSLLRNLGFFALWFYKDAGPAGLRKSVFHFRIAGTGKPGRNRLLKHFGFQSGFLADDLCDV